VFCKNNKEYKDLWIVSERGQDARDNGYHFFSYLRDKQPQINCVYIITEDPPDREKVLKLGKVIKYRSFAHYMAFACSSIKVSTHIMGYSPDTYLYSKLDKFNLVFGKKIFLQHGIIKDDLTELHYPTVKLNLFVCGAKPEYEYIKKVYGHPKNVPQYTGLCRYDNLLKSNNRENQILCMPTWRLWLQHCSGDDEFMQSEYYRSYNSLMNNQKLAELLEKYNYKLMFYPHFEFQKYIHTFKPCSDRFVLADFKGFDIQRLLVECKMMVTDFSSVFFDNAYMKKPVVFYQFDEEKFRSGHYKEGYFDYRRDGFGPVLQTESELVDFIEKTLCSGMKLSGYYEKRIDGFFTKIDADNCQRTYEAILRS